MKLGMGLRGESESGKEIEGERQSRERRGERGEIHKEGIKIERREKK